jgi:hypothetical protein
MGLCGSNRPGDNRAIQISRRVDQRSWCSHCRSNGSGFSLVGRRWRGCDREYAPGDYGFGLRVVLRTGGCLATRGAIQDPFERNKRKTGDGTGTDWDIGGDADAEEEIFRGDTPLGKILTRPFKGTGLKAKWVRQFAVCLSICGRTH